MKSRVDHYLYVALGLVLLTYVGLEMRTSNDSTPGTLDIFPTGFFDQLKEISIAEADKSNLRIIKKGDEWFFSTEEKKTQVYPDIVFAKLRAYEPTDILELSRVPTEDFESVSRLRLESEDSQVYILSLGKNKSLSGDRYLLVETPHTSSSKVFLLNERGQHKIAWSSLDLIGNQIFPEKKKVFKLSFFEGGSKSEAQIVLGSDTAYYQRNELKIFLARDELLSDLTSLSYIEAYDSSLYGAGDWAKFGIDPSSKEPSKEVRLYHTNDDYRSLVLSDKSDYLSFVYDGARGILGSGLSRSIRLLHGDITQYVDESNYHLVEFKNVKQLSCEQPGVFSEKVFTHKGDFFASKERRFKFQDFANAVYSLDPEKIYFKDKDPLAKAQMSVKLLGESPKEFELHFFYRDKTLFFYKVGEAFYFSVKKYANQQLDILRTLCFGALK